MVAARAGGLHRSPQPQPRSPQAATPATTTAPVIAATELRDISERGPRYMIGISFPPELKRYPALAAEVKRDSDTLRADFLKQSGDNVAAGASGMFDLSLAYSMVAQSPRIVAVAAEGTSRRRRGAHVAAPLLERWLPGCRRKTGA